MESFGAAYLAANPGCAYRDADQVRAPKHSHCNFNLNLQLQLQLQIFVLAFSIIMLNTDLHNPNIPPEKKMTLQQYVPCLHWAACSVRRCEKRMTLEQQARRVHCSA